MGRGRDMLYALGGLISSPAWGLRLARTGKWRTDWPARFGRCVQLPQNGRPTMLIHAVSVGEVNATRAMVDMLHHRTRGRWRIVISATTDTGIARARQLYEPTHTVIRYPLDFSCCVTKVLDAIQPNVVALVELEVWPNFVEQCTRRSIPVCVVNGRLSARSFARYRLIAPLLRKTFGCLAAVAAQTSAYADHFHSLGVPSSRVSVTDSMKWDTARIEDASEVRGAAELAQDMGIDRTRPLIVAGSTGPGEERMLIETKPRGVQLMLVPRKPERFDEVAALAPMVRRTASGLEPAGDHFAQPPRGDLFLLDTMGELRKAYALADVAIVGRSFLGLHGSDPIEPVALGKPTLIGPHHDDFKDIVSAFVQAGGIEVTSRPCDRAAEFLHDRQEANEMSKRGRDVIRQHQGATARNVDLIMRMMEVSS